MLWTRTDPAVPAWLDDQPDAELFLSVATFGEIRMGLERLKTHDLVQAAVLVHRADSLSTRYRSRIFNGTLSIFEKWRIFQGVRPIPGN